jgi:hypothetical protein
MRADTRVGLMLSLNDQIRVLELGRRMRDEFPQVEVVQKRWVSPDRVRLSEVFQIFRVSRSAVSSPGSCIGVRGAPCLLSIGFFFPHLNKPRGARSSLPVGMSQCCRDPGPLASAVGRNLAS